MTVHPHAAENKAINNMVQPVQHPVLTPRPVVPIKPPADPDPLPPQTLHDVTDGAGMSQVLSPLQETVLSAVEYASGTGGVLAAALIAVVLYEFTR